MLPIANCPGKVGSSKRDRVPTKVGRGLFISSSDSLTSFRLEGIWETEQQASWKFYDPAHGITLSHAACQGTTSHALDRRVYTRMAL